MKTVTCDECHKQVNQKVRCVCDMWVCLQCTMWPNSRHNTSYDKEHVKMSLVPQHMSEEEYNETERMIEEVSRLIDR